MFYPLTLPPAMARKQAAHLIAEHTGSACRYLGAPSMAYEIAEYTLTRTGTLITPGELDPALAEALASAGIQVGGWPPSRMVEVDLAGWPASARGNLTRMVEAYGPLIGRALDLPTPACVQVDEVAARFEWTRHLDAHDFEAARALLVAMANMARQARRVRGIPPQDDNDRYAMRTFLYRAGLGGPAHKTTRHALTRRLSGNGAWRHPPRKETPA